ncbi:MAG: hypothetical protein JXR46_02305 [Calditrichaceae bacterium]|nr:hypothetical protein [Calditrichaceae bacterium]MBN2707854.1 hypothetical protein [Calditrichaceae bacterium]RQV94920.1 MAG: hypothetical protein EH224_09160 [Calditrichota bacterium]
MNHEDVVNKSGFPLQIALENLIGREQKPVGWRVIYSEHQWKNSDTNESGFIDLVLELTGGVIVLVIECKRVYDSSWIFLNSKGELNDRKHTKAWVSNLVNEEFKRFNWCDITVLPSSPECEYSIVSGQDPKSKPMLERTASTLISSTEAFAKEQSKYFSRARDKGLYFNVIVTTADLIIGEFHPKSISISNGTINGAKFHEVPFLRFRKQLQPHIETITKNSFDHSVLAKAKENSVFVVNSKHFTEFLNSFNVDNLHSIL